MTLFEEEYDPILYLAFSQSVRNKSFVFTYDLLPTPTWSYGSFEVHFVCCYFVTGKVNIVKVFK